MLDTADPPHIVQQCQQLLQSDAMFLVLSNLTGLKLHELAPESDSEDSEGETTTDGQCTDVTQDTDVTGFIVSVIILLQQFMMMD